MSVSGKIISMIDSIIYAYKSGIKKDLKDYCSLESVVGSHTLIAKDGSLATIFELYGSSKYVGENEVNELEEKLYSTLKNSLQREGHILQFVFSRDKERVKEHIVNLLEPYRRTAKEDLDLDLEDMFASKIDFLSKSCAYESTYIVVWTKPEAIKEFLKKQQEENLKRAKNAPLIVDAQNIIIEYERLEDVHNSFCSIINDSFQKANLKLEKIHVRKAIRDIRRTIDYTTTDKNWEASLPIKLDEENIAEKEINLQMTTKKRYRENESDISGYMWQSLSKQMFVDSIEVRSSNVLKIGKKYISSMYMDIPPQNVKPFKNLMDTLNNNTPIQISFTLESGGLNKEKMKALFASILAVTNSGNKMVQNSIEHLRNLEQQGETIVKMTVNALTWSESEKELEERKSFLIKKLQNWGNAQIVFNNIDPIEGFLATCPAVSNKTSGNAALAPLLDVIKMLPLSRQSHIWDEGSILFTTEDGKISPYQPGSSLQNTWNDIIFALPGSGKSVLLNAMNLSSIYQYGNKELPYIGIIDIGPSSYGVVSLIKSALKKEFKDQVIFKRLQNDKKYGMNILDTFLGCRKPTPSGKIFIQNFLTLLMTPAGQSKPYASSDAMVSRIVEKAYEYYSDSPNSNPKRYEKGRVAKIDMVLEKLGINADGKTWWWVVDELFKKKQIKAASYAQRYAVPLIEELVAIAMNTPSIKDDYTEPKAETEESMIKLFSRSISEIVQQYPMLNIPTVFDVSNAKIIALDIDEVAKGQDPASIKQTNIMFMLARNIVAGKFKLSPDEIDTVVPDLYRTYLMTEAKKMKGIKKRLCMDEFHRTKGQVSVRNQVITDQREGRKWNLQVSLASQDISDFDKEMRDLSTNIFILSGGSTNYRDLTDMFSFNDTTSQIICSRLNGAEKGKGVPLIFNTKTKRGEYSQFVYFSISNIELWSFTTTAEDVELRTKLIEEVKSVGLAIALLAKHVGGSAKSTIEKMQKDSSDDPYEKIIKIIKEKENILF